MIPEWPHLSLTAHLLGTEPFTTAVWPTTRQARPGEGSVERRGGRETGDVDRARLFELERASRQHRADSQAGKQATDIRPDRFVLEEVDRLEEEQGSVSAVPTK